MLKYWKVAWINSSPNRIPSIPVWAKEICFLSGGHGGVERARMVMIGMCLKVKILCVKIIFGADLGMDKNGEIQRL